MLTDNELQFFTGYYDPQGENRTGVSAENTVITIDGQDIKNFANTDQAVTGSVTLPNGCHSIKVEIMDGFGNRASVTRTFTVKVRAAIPTLTLDAPSYALVGENYVVNVTSPNAGKIDSVTAHIVYGNVDLFDTDENGGKGAFNTCASLGVFCCPERGGPGRKDRHREHEPYRLCREGPVHLHYAHARRGHGTGQPAHFRYCVLHL